jgi:hypothetical protein
VVVCFLAFSLHVKTIVVINSETRFKFFYIRMFVACYFLPSEEKISKAFPF